MQEPLKPAQKPRFGIGEWYGELFTGLSRVDRVRLDALRKRGKLGNAICPFKPASGSCNKLGGVCSLRLYDEGEDGTAIPAPGPTGSLRALCPNRFRQGGAIERWIGQALLGTDEPISVGEVGFLQSTLGTEEAERDDVGRIDQVLVHPDLGSSKWCAVEVQAVYFSGSEMGAEFDIASSFDSDEAPFPAKKRRPDYRSSGPKRLMPQLQIKVPTLRRWGKRMAVVVDEAFFASLGQMDSVEHASNADIAWFVIRFEIVNGAAILQPAFVQHTTLERAVEGLTAGIPLNLEEFESRIREKIERTRTRATKGRG